MNSELQEAKDHLDTYGYCLLEDRISEELARSMAEKFLELHADPRYQENIVGDRYYQTLFGILNLDERSWICASHQDVTAIAGHFLGPNVRAAEGCSKPTWPGAPANPCTWIRPENLSRSLIFHG